MSASGPGWGPCVWAFVGVPVLGGGVSAHSTGAGTVRLEERRWAVSPEDSVTRPVAWVLSGLPPYDASEAVDGVVDPALDDDLCARVEPWWDPGRQATVDGSEVTDGGW